MLVFHLVCRSPPQNTTAVGLAASPPSSTIRLPPPTDAPPVTTADLDALDATAEIQFLNPAARYSHTNWAQEQQDEPACNAAMRYITLGRPEAFPSDFVSCFPSHQRPLFSEVLEPANIGHLHTTDAGIVLPVRQPPPPQRPVGCTTCVLNDKPIRIYVLLLIRPWVMRAFHSSATCHLETARTIRMPERFNWWI